MRLDRGIQDRDRYKRHGEQRERMAYHEPVAEPQRRQCRRAGSPSGPEAGGGEGGKGGDRNQRGDAIHPAEHRKAEQAPGSGADQVDSVDLTNRPGAARQR